MPLQYTTIEAVSQRLATRVKIGGTASSFGGSVADPALLEQIGVQVEARVNAKLRKRYQMPLRGQHPELASIVEKFIIEELLSTYFVGSDASNAEGFGALMGSQAKAEMELLYTGETILLGEIILPANQSIGSSYAGAAKYSPGPAEKITW